MKCFVSSIYVLSEKCLIYDYVQLLNNDVILTLFALINIIEIIILF